jgi:hypothetical protein
MLMIIPAPTVYVEYIKSCFLPLLSINPAENIDISSFKTPNATLMSKELVEENPLSSNIIGA